MAATLPSGCQVKSSPKKAGREQGPGCASWTQGSPQHWDQAPPGWAKWWRQELWHWVLHWDRHRTPCPSLDSTISLKITSSLDTVTNILLLLKHFGCHKKSLATLPQSGFNFFSWLETRSCHKCLPIWRLSSLGNLLGVENYTETALKSLRCPKMRYILKIQQGPKITRKTPCILEHWQKKIPESLPGIVAIEIEIMEKTPNVWTNQRGQIQWISYHKLSTQSWLSYKARELSPLNAMVLEWKQN